MKSVTTSVQTIESEKPLHISGRIGMFTDRAKSLNVLFLILPYNNRCQFDGGDCIEFNSNYPDCPAEKPYTVGDGTCNQENNIEECKFDGGDCCPFDVTRTPGKCDGGLYNALNCMFDFDECREFNRKYPDCEAPDPYRVGDGVCDGVNYMTNECGFDGGDCERCLANLENTTLNERLVDISKVGNGFCDGGEVLMSDECGNDGGDCEGCNIDPGDCDGCDKKIDPRLIGNSYCFGNGTIFGDLNTKACSYDGERRSIYQLIFFLCRYATITILFIFLLNDKVVTVTNTMRNIHCVQMDFYFMSAT